MIGYSCYRVIDAKTRQYKCSTSAYPNYHHSHALLVSENIPGSDLLQELHPVPYERDAFQQYTLTCLRSFRTHYLSRHMPELAAACNKCRSCRAYHRNHQGYHGKLPAEIEFQWSESEHHAVCCPHGVREEFRSRQKSDGTPYHRC